MKTHMKRLSTPKTWPIKRKGIRFVTRPNPGAHTLGESMAISTVLTEILCAAKNKREAENILNAGKVIVDGVVRKDGKFAIGLMDVLTLGEENYRVLINTKGKLYFKKIKKEEAELKPCKVLNKTTLKGGVIQVNLADGRNLLLKEDKYQPGDTIIFSNKAVKKHLKFEKGATVYLTGGKHIGTTGIIEEVINSPGSLPARISIKSGKEKMIGLKKHTFVIEESIVQ